MCYSISHDFISEQEMVGMITKTFITKKGLIEIEDFDNGLEEQTVPYFTEMSEIPQSVSLQRQQERSTQIIFIS